MVNDLFGAKEVHRSKKEQVLAFIKGKGRARTSDVLAFGSSIYFNGAVRVAQQYAHEGVIWRMREDIKNIVFGYKVKEEAWSIFEADR